MRLYFDIENFITELSDEQKKVLLKRLVIDVDFNY